MSTKQIKAINKGVDDGISSHKKELKLQTENVKSQMSAEIRPNESESFKEHCEVIMNDIVDIKDDVKQLASDLLYLPGAAVDGSLEFVSGAKTRVIDVMCDVRDTVLTKGTTMATTACNKAMSTSTNFATSAIRSCLGLGKSVANKAADLTVDALDSGRDLVKGLVLTPTLAGIEVAKDVGRAVTNTTVGIVHDVETSVGKLGDTVLHIGKDAVDAAAGVGTGLGRRALEVTATAAGTVAGIGSVAVDTASWGINTAGGIAKGAANIAVAPVKATVGVVKSILGSGGDTAASCSSGACDSANGHDVAECFDKNGNKVLLKKSGKSGVQIIMHEAPACTGGKCDLIDVPHPHPKN